jgi:gliding motility-associated-like protein
VGDLQANVDFTYAKSGGCQSLQFDFTNTSQWPPSRPFTDTSFVWDFGDGSPLVIAGMNVVTHTFPTAGPYTVILTLRDTAYCNYPDSDTMRINVAENVDASFSIPPTGCVPFSAEFDNTSLAGETWLWDFGDNTTSTDFEPVHVYSTPGTYQVVLIAYNPNTCNQTDTARFTITVYDSPVPDFTHSPVVPVVNTPVRFTNNSSPDAINFKWVFGDGDSLITTSRAPIDHQYNASGTFTACLTAYNEIGCESTVCRPVDALIEPLVDVPNAFTPQSNDVNSVVYVKGYGIAKMQFVIWNRWGQKVFETNNSKQGWDGRVKGVVQPMDVYAYTLSVEFFDGTKTTKKGDITLIR